jgi:hypothetical protein
MLRRSRAAIAALVVVLFVLARPATALEVRSTELSTSATIVQAAFELKDLLTDHFKRLIDQGGVAHLRLQLEVWERRPTWDLLVYPAAVRVVQVSKLPTGAGILLIDEGGAETRHDSVPAALPMTIALGAADRLKTNARYYVRVLATMGTIAERQADEYSDAVFGKPGETNGLGSLGRMVMRRMLQISDYLQSVSAEGRSSVVSGTQLLRR